MVNLRAAADWSGAEAEDTGQLGCTLDIRKSLLTHRVQRSLRVGNLDFDVSAQAVSVDSHVEDEMEVWKRIKLDKCVR